MARVTVEDCLDHVSNRFELVLLAAKRARRLIEGAEPLIDTDEDKCTVIALREIAEGLISPSYTGEKAEVDSEVLEISEAEASDPGEDEKEIQPTE